LCDFLAEGKVVGLPTETVYGLAADAFNDQAVASIFHIKGRPEFNPLIVHVGSIEQVEMLAYITPLARELAATFWPGPLTLVLEKKPHGSLSPLVTAGLDTVAVRMPANELARRVLETYG